MKKMKILILTHYFQPHIGGIEIIAYNQAKEIVKSGYQVTIITSKIGEESEEEIIDGIKVKRIKAWNFFEDKFGIAFPIFSLNLFSVLKEEIKNNDVIHVHGVWCIPSLLGAFLSKLYNKKLIIAEHVGIVRTKSFLVTGIQKVIFYFFGRFMLQYSDKIIVYNEKVGDWINKKDKTVYLINGVNISIFKPATIKEKKEIKIKYGFPFSKKLILFVGRLTEKKGFDKLFEARDKDYLIIFIGSGIVPENMKKDKNVLFLEPIHQEGLAKIYQASDIFCLPSKNEGFPLSIQEAMVSGLPIITTDHPGYENYLDRKYVKLIDPTSKSIKNTLKEVLNDEVLMKKMKNYSRNTAIEKFSWKKNVTELIKIYKQILS